MILDLTALGRKPVKLSQFFTLFSIPRNFLENGIIFNSHTHYSEQLFNSKIFPSPTKYTRKMCVQPKYTETCVTTNTAMGTTHCMRFSCTFALTVILISFRNTIKQFVLCDVSCVFAPLAHLTHKWRLRKQRICRWRKSDYPETSHPRFWASPYPKSLFLDHRSV